MELRYLFMFCVSKVLNVTASRCNLFKKLYLSCLAVKSRPAADIFNKLASITNQHKKE